MAKVKEETEDAEMEAKTKTPEVEGQCEDRDDGRSTKTEVDGQGERKGAGECRECAVQDGTDAAANVPHPTARQPRAHAARGRRQCLWDWRADADARIQAGILERRDQRLAQEGASPVRTAARASPVRNRAAPPSPK